MEDISSGLIVSYTVDSNTGLIAFKSNVNHGIGDAGPIIISEDGQYIFTAVSTGSLCATRHLGNGVMLELGCNTPPPTLTDLASLAIIYKTIH